MSLSLSVKWKYAIWDNTTHTTHIESSVLIWSVGKNTNRCM